MRKILIAIALTCATPATASQVLSDLSTAAPTEADRADVEKMVYRFEAAWNAHDMKVFADLFHEDAEWVHWRGGLWTGKPAIYQGHKEIHESYYSKTKATVQGIEALHFLSPTVAYLRVRSDMQGDARAGTNLPLPPDDDPEQTRRKMAYHQGPQHTNCGRTAVTG